MFSHDKLLWHLQFHSLFDFLHEQKLFRHDVLQLHLLYPWPPNSDAFLVHSFKEPLTDGTPEMVTVLSIHVVNWLRVYNEFSKPSSLPISYRSLVRSISIITPKMFLESHLPRSTSGTRNFAVSPIFPGGNFSQASLVMLNTCVSKLLFTNYLSFFNNLVLALNTH